MKFQRLIQDFSIKTTSLTLTFFVIVLTFNNIMSQPSESEFNLNQKNALVFIESKEFEKAIPLLEENLTYLVYFEKELIRDVDLYYQHLSVCYEKIGKYEKANECLKKLIEIREKYFNKEEKISEIVLYYTKIIENFYSISDYKSAIIFNHKLINLLKTVEFEKNYKLYFGALTNLANLYESISDFDVSSNLHESNLREIENTLGKENDIYAYELISYAHLNTLQGDYEKGIENLNKAIQISKIIKDISLELKARSSINEINSKLGFHEKALESEFQIAEITQKLFGKHSKENYLSKMNIVEFYLKLNQFDKALLMHDSIMMKSDSIFGVLSSNHLTNLSNTVYFLTFLEKYDEALKISDYLLDLISNKIGGNSLFYFNTLNRVVTIHMLTKNYSKAVNLQKQIYDNSLNSSKRQLVKSLNDLFYINLYALNYVENDSIFPKLIAQEFSLQKVLNSGLTENEVKTFNSVSIYDNILFYTSYVFFRSETHNYYIQTILNSLINYKSLSINIQREIQEELAAKNDKILTEQFQEWKSKKQQLAKLYELTPDELKSREINLEEKENEANLIEQQLSKQLKTFADKDKTFVWEDIREKLNEDEVFIEMLRLPVFDFNKMQKTDSVTYVAYIIKKESSEPEIVLLTNGRELEGDFFQDYYATTTNRRSETGVLTGNSYEHFWKEIQTRIGTKKKVFIALDGVFNKINLNTLYNPGEKKYLLETLEINYVTNTIDFIKKPRISESNLISWKDAVLFGNPNFNQTNSTNGNNGLALYTSRDIPSFWMDSLTRGSVVKDLPQTKVEIENISKILEKSKIKVISYLENDATEENIKQVKSPSILHIATHGYFFEDDLHPDFEEEKYFGLERKQFNMNPMLRSGLLLAGANETIKSNTKKTGENGILTSLEASYLNLEQTELVILSACETGLGKIQNGVGVYGLRKSMKDAGAKNVIMSLWKVDDKVSQEFMTLFYTKLMSGQTIKQAFTKTQLEMKEKYPQPFFWGAFILSEN